MTLKSSRRRKCKTCREWFHPVRPIQPTCLATECMTAYAIKFNDKAREKKLAKLRREKVAAKRRNRQRKRDFDRQDLKWQHEQTQKVFNKMRRLEELLWFQARGLEPECISCGKAQMDWCCGHFKTRGSQPGLRYDRNNTFLQCNNYCNKNLSGNIEGNKTTRGYKQGLRERFGQTEGEWIIDYCETNTAPVKWEWQQLEAMRKEFAAKTKALEAQLHIC